MVKTYKFAQNGKNIIYLRKGTYTIYSLIYPDEIQIVETKMFIITLKLHVHCLRNV